MVSREPAHDRALAGANAVGRLERLAPHLRADLHSAGPATGLTAADSLLTVAWRSRWIVLTCIVVTLVAGAVYIKTATPIYESAAKVYLDYAALRISNMYDASGRPQADKYLSTQAELITSTPIISAALGDLQPQRLKTFSNVTIPSAYLQQHLDVRVGRKDEILTVAFRSAYPEEAANIVNSVVNAYLKFRTEREKTSSSEILGSLQAYANRTKEELEQKQNRLRAFEDANMPLAGGSDKGADIILRGLESRQAMYIQAHSEATDANEFRQSVMRLKNDPAALRQYLQTKPQIRVAGLSDAISQRDPLEKRAIDLQIQRKGLSESFAPDHPRILGLDIELEQISRKLAELDDRFVNAVLVAAEQHCREARATEVQCEKEYREQWERFREVNAEINQHATLQSDVDALTLYVQQKLEDQMREVSKIAGEEDIGQLKMAILEEARAATVPAAPRKSRVMAMALVGGLLLGGGAAVVKDWLNQTLHSAEEVSTLLGLPILGVVPPMPSRQRLQDRGRKVLLQPDSHEAEVFRMVRTAVFFGAPKDRAKTMLVTSPGAGDGKSTLVSNLAIAIARAGQKTIILDADMRKPMQHQIFELDHQERCLSKVFAGKMKLGAAIQPTGVRDLHLLTYGQGVSNPAEVVNNPQFGRLLRCLAEVYDRIVIDAPPVTVVADAQIISALCDVSILVLRADKSTRRMAQRAMSALGSANARVLGVVVNDIHKSQDRYYNYGQRYHTGDDSESHNGGKDPILIDSKSRMANLLQGLKKK